MFGYFIEKTNRQKQLTDLENDIQKETTKLIASQIGIPDLGRTTLNSINKLVGFNPNSRAIPVDFLTPKQQCEYFIKMFANILVDALIKKKQKLALRE